MHLVLMATQAESKAKFQIPNTIPLKHLSFLFIKHKNVVLNHMKQHAERY